MTTPEEFREKINRVSKDFLLRELEHPPMVMMLIEDKKGETEIVQIPLPPHLMQNHHGKEIIAKILMPAAIEKARKEGFMVLCLSLVSEVFLWSASFSKDEKKSLSMEEIKKKAYAGKKQEALIVTYETYNKSLITTHSFNRINGKIVMEDTEQTSHGEGRFSRLLKPPLHAN